MTTCSNGLSDNRLNSTTVAERISHCAVDELASLGHVQEEWGEGRIKQVSSSCLDSWSNGDLVVTGCTGSADSRQQMRMETEAGSNGRIVSEVDSQSELTCSTSCIGEISPDNLYDCDGTTACLANGSVIEVPVTASPTSCETLSQEQSSSFAGHISHQAGSESGLPIGGTSLTSISEPASFSLSHAASSPSKPSPLINSIPLLSIPQADVSLSLIHI